MKKTFIIFSFFIAFISSCDKKKDEPVNEPEPIPPPTDTTYTCGKLPNAPKPFGWQDTLSDEEKNINSFVYSPLNPDQLVYMVNGTIFGGFNKLYTYTIPSKQSLFLGSNLNYLPQVNKSGWIVYSDVNSDLYKVKLNGDSSIKITTNQLSDNPRWDYSGNYVYFFQKANNSTPSQVIKLSKDGNIVSAFQAELPTIASFNKSDKLLYLKVINNSFVRIIEKNMVNAEEKELISGPKESKAGQVNFDNLCVDRSDEHFFWSNSNGIFSCNLTSLKIDTLFKNCENFIYSNPLVSFKENELYYNLHIIKPLSVYKLLHTYKSMEYNLVSKQSSEVKIFP